MNRRQQIRPHAPTLSRGEDVRPACEGNPWPYDALTDTTRGNHVALKAAREMCGRCPLRDKCLTENAGEQWAKAVLGLSQKTGQPKQHTAARVITAQRHHDRRWRRVQRYVNDGRDLADILARLGLTRSAFRQWCMRWEHMDVYRELAARHDAGRAA